MPPKFLFFHWTLENYVEVQSRIDYLLHAYNSIVLSVGANIARPHHRDPRRLVDGVRADQAHQGSPDVDAVDQDDAGRRRVHGDLLPVPRVHLLDSRWGIGFVLMMVNLPILVWMLYTYFKEIPVDILEAARMDGASLINEIVYVLTPMAIPGIASTMLLAVILSWNEAFWTLNLDDLQCGAADHLHRVLFGARKASSGPSSRPPRRWRSRRSSSSAGSRRSNSCAASPSAPSNSGPR